MSDSVLTLHNKGAQYHILLPAYEPHHVVSLIWRAVEDEGHPLVNDMGRLGMHIIDQAIAVRGSRLIGGPHLKITPTMSQIFQLDRPERSLKLIMETIIRDPDQPGRRHEVFRGAFADFKKYLPTIMASIRGEI